MADVIEKARAVLEESAWPIASRAAAHVLAALHHAPAFCGRVVATAFGPRDALQKFATLPSALAKLSAAIQGAGIESAPVVDAPSAVAALRTLPDVLRDAFPLDGAAELGKSANAVAEQIDDILAFDLSGTDEVGILKRVDHVHGHGGIHEHRLFPDRKKTATDGRHAHLFLVGEALVSTAIDGEHEHAVGAGEDRLDVSGPHVHALTLPDGTVVETSEEGVHAHDLQVSGTAWDGVHAHEARLPDGALIRSLLPSELAERLRRVRDDRRE